MTRSLIKRQDTAVADIQQPSESTAILQIITRAASDPSCDIEKLERLM